MFWFNSRVLAFASLIGATFGLGSILPGYFLRYEICTVDCYKLYQKNLLSKAWPRYPLADEIVASGAAFVTLQEVSSHNLKFMRKLFESYPSKVTCPFQKEKTVAALSIYPATPGSATCGEKAGLAIMQVLLPDGRKVWIASLHLDWPFPYSQREHVDEVIARLGALSGPVILGGDFNMVPWGSSVARISSAARATLLGPYQLSYPKFGKLFPLPIDHILVPEGATGTTKVKRLHGSDHMGTVATFSFR